MAATDRFGNIVNPSAELAIKTPVRAATTANIVLSGLQTIDAIALLSGDRVLVCQQTDQTTNGIYNASSGNWTRASDASSNTSWVGGTHVRVVRGAVNAGLVFELTCLDAPIVLGTSLMTFSSALTASTLQVGSFTTPYQFIVNRPGAVNGSLLQMQKGISGTLYAPGVNVSTNAINLQLLTDAGAGNPAVATIHNGFSTDVRLQAGVGGTALGASFNATAELSNTQPGPYGGATGAQFIARSRVGGGVFGSNPYAWLDTTAGGTCVGTEVDTDVRVNGTLGKKCLQLADVATSTGTITGSGFANTCIHVLAQVGALGYKYGLVFGDPASQFPMTSNGVILSSMAGTIATGIDLSALTISGNAFISPGFTVTGGGAVTTNQVTGNQFVNVGLVGVFSGQLGLSGITSGFVAIKPQAAAGTYNFNLPTTAGSAGNVLLSGGGGTNPMTWSGAVTIPGATTISDATASTTTGTGALIVSGGVGVAKKIFAGDNIDTAGVFTKGGTQVVGARVTGYAAMTGTPDKATAFATSTVTLAQLAGRVMQLQADFTTHGLIGA